jgi:hypothetical protein
MFSLLVTPSLLVTVLCTASPAPAVTPPGSGVVQPVKEAFSDHDDGDEAEEYDPVENLDPDNSVVAAGKGVGAVCATSCALGALGALLMLIPGLGWLGALGLQVLNPIISAGVGWYVLQKSAQRRVPCCAMVAGSSLPFWGSMAVSAVAMVVAVLVAAMVAAGSLVAVIFANPSNTGATLFGAYFSALFPLLIVGGVALLAAVGMGGALALGSGLSGVLGVALGRALTDGESDFHIDLIKVPRVPRERFRPRDRGRRPPPRDTRPSEEAPRPPPVPEAPVAPPPDEPVTPPPNSF